jgi:hypothetical protein
MVARVVRGFDGRVDCVPSGVIRVAVLAIELNRPLALVKHHEILISVHVRVRREVITHRKIVWGRKVPHALQSQQAFQQEGGANDQRGFARN